MINNINEDKIFLGQTLLRRYAKLKQKKYRDEDGMFIAEGVKICEELIKSDYEIEALILDAGGKLSSRAMEVVENYRKKKIRILWASEASFAKISDTKTPQSLIAIAKTGGKEVNPAAEKFIVLENVNDPGNLGTIIRTARWFGISDIVLSYGSADIYSPKTVRASMGNLFAVHFSYAEDLTAFCREKFPEHRLLGTDLKAEISIDQIDSRGKIGVFFGSEADGLSPEVVSAMDETFIIPAVNGEVESLNLSVSAGIVLYRFCEIK